MSETLRLVKNLVEGGDIQISAHGYDELAADDVLPEETAMMKKSVSKLVHEGDYAAEVDVELIYTNDEWSPYLSLSDAQKLDAVRLALKRGDLQAASRLARVFELVPVAAC